MAQIKKTRENARSVGLNDRSRAIVGKNCDRIRGVAAEARQGSEYGFCGEYREIVRPERIVQTFEFEGMPGHISLDTLVFEDVGGRTRLVGTSVFDSIEDRDGMLQSGMEQGAAELFIRLAEYLQTMAA